MPERGLGTPPGPQLSNAVPLAPGTASAGVSALVARGDHVHPVQTFNVPVAGSNSPLADTNPAVVGVSNAYAREDHAHPLFAVTPAVSTRVIGTTFQPSATKAVLVSYSVRTQVTNPLVAGTSTALVTLLSDASNPPTTERARVAAESSVALAVAVAITTSNTAPVSYLVPPGHFVRLASTTTGTAATSIASQVEEVIG